MSYKLHTTSPAGKENLTEERKASPASGSILKVTWTDPKWPVLLGGLAVLVRLMYVLVMGKQELAWGDEFVYDLLAKNILQHDCYCFIAGQPSVWRPPLYPIVLAGIYAIFGPSHMAVRIVQALIGGLSAPLLVWVGKQISGSTSVALLGGVMLALYPVLIFTTGLLYSETLYVTLLLLIVYGCTKLAHSRVHWIVLSAGIGVLFGISVLMRPNLILFPVWLLIWGWAVFRNLRKAVEATAVIALTMALTILPWSIRNYQVTGALVPVSANTGLNLLQGNYPQADGGALDFQYVDPLPQLSEKDRDDAYWQRGMEWIRGNPGDFIRLIPLKLYKFFSPLETSNRGQLLTRIAPLILAGAGLYYLVALVGTIVSTKRWQAWLLAYMLIAYPALLAVVFYGGTRYGLVTQPFIILLVAQGIVALVSRAKAFRAQP